jgi:hypothetical protein
MASYFENFKWILFGKTETPNKICLNNNINVTYLDSDSDSDSDSEYHKIDVKGQNILKTNLINKNDLFPYTHASAKDDYEKIYKELLDKEQSVIKHVGVDTFEKIKQNYTEYINDDVQIIKEFASVMKTFDNIKTKLENFEFDIKKNIVNQDENKFEINENKFEINENKFEIDEKINLIDSKLNDTIKMINKINFDSDEFIKKIINLENLIKNHDDRRYKIILKLEKFNKEYNEMKNNNFNIYKDIKKYFMFLNTNYFKYMGISFGICSCLFFSLKLFKKNKS